jgi:hypothetical protein
MTSTDMNEIEQLAILGTQAKERRKTNLSDDELRFATELGTAALSKETVDMTAMLDALDSLPVRATAEIVGKSWENLASERKSLLVRWITRRESDRAQKRIVHCASRILPSDPLTTVDFLAVVLPRDQSMSQELKGDLRRAFMGKLAPDLDLLADEKLNPEVLGRFCWCAFASLDTEVSFAKRQQLAKLAAQVFTRLGKGSPIAVSLSAALEKEMRTWPQMARTQFAQQFWPELASAGGASESAVVGIPAEERASELAVQVAGDGSDRQWVSERLKQVRRELDVLARLERALNNQQEVDQLEKRIDALQRELEARGAQLDNALHRTSELQAKLNTAEGELAEARASLQSREAELGGCRGEIARLVGQISATSDTAVAEFKERLGATLRKLAADLPERTTELDVDRLRFVLRQYHQFIDKLGEHGIAVRAHGVRG